MIAYEELAAALERWRIRNGLPGTPPLFADGPRKAAAAAASYAAPVATYAPPAAAAYAPPAAAAYAPPAPRTAPPSPPPAAPPPPAPETIDEDLGEADVLDEDHLDNDGPDFAMSFSDSPKPPAPVRPAVGMTADEARESSLLGSTDPGIVPPAAGEDEDEEDGDEVWPEAATYQHADAGRAPATVVDDDDDDDGGTLVNG